MRFAYADPPYYGMGAKLYGAHHPDAAAWDEPQAHADLVRSLIDEYPDGWAISLHEPSLRLYLAHVPADARVMAWVKPFAAFKRNVRIAHTWEPVIVWGGRKSAKDGAPPCRDHIAESIAMRRGLPGAKPERVCSWVLDLLGWVPGDVVDDLFPGTAVMGRVVQARSLLPAPGHLSLWDLEGMAPAAAEQQRI